jgi:hypothetical protein
MVLSLSTGTGGVETNQEELKGGGLSDLAIRQPAAALER